MRMKRRVTITDVARESGCSPATVSRVLNGTAPVAAEKAQRVLRAAEVLGYLPDPAAKALAGQGTRAIGLLLPDIVNPFFPMLARGVEDVAHARNYTVLLGNTDNRVAEVIHYIESFLRYRCDGLILVGETPALADGIEATVQRFGYGEGAERPPLPLVWLDRVDAMSNADVVTADNERGAALAVAHLLACDYRRIALIEGPHGTSTADQRKTGYLEALAAHGIAQRDEWIFSGDFSFQSGVSVMERILALPPSKRPDAILATNDLMAIGALSVALRAGVSVPDDFGFCGFDDIILGTMIYPALTTVAQPTYLLGATATDLLIDRIEGQYQGPSRRHVLDVELVARETTRRLAEEAADGVVAG